LLPKNIVFLQKNDTMDLPQEEWVSQYEADENAVILDVRTENECNDGIIADSINIDFYEGQGFIQKLETLDKSKKYYLYCRSGVRSAKACEIMESLGFDYTYNLEGGILGWNGDVVSP
jgi:rhodanese-related sulfurtransferase